MGKMKGAGMNAKAAAALEQKAAHQKSVAEKDAAKRSKEEEKEWASGSNARKADREQQAAAKADEAARKRREKAELLAQEEEGLEKISGKGVKKAPTLSKKKKKGNDLSLLDDFVDKADKKNRAKLKAEREKKENLELEAKLKAEKIAAEKAKLDPLLANTEAMIAGTEDDLIGRAANKALDDVDGVSGIDGALKTMDVSGPGGVPSVNMKALYKAFEERMMPIVKEDFPGLRMSQYKERIFAMWKKSPENPNNQNP